MKILTGLLTSLIVVNSISVYADNSAKFQQCAVDLCGPTSKYARILGNGIFAVADRDTKEYLAQEMDPKLEELVATSLKQKQAAYALADDYIQKPVQLNIYEKSVLAVLSFIGRIKPVIEECVVSPDGVSFQISASKLLEKMPTLGEREAKQITVVLNMYLGTSGFKNGSAMSRVSYDFLLQSWGANSSYYLSNVRKQALGMVEKLGPFVTTRWNLDLLQRMALNATLSTADKAEASKMLESIYRLSGMIDESVQLAVGPLDLNLQTVAKSLNWDDAYKKMNQMVSSPEKLKEQKDAVMNYCRTAITKSLAATPSALRQRKSIELLDQVKASALAVAPQYFTGETLDTVGKSIQSVKFDYPKNAQEVKASNSAVFNENFGIVQRTQSLLDKAQSDQSVRQSAAIFTLMNSGQETDNLFQNLHDVCEKIAPPNFEDAAFKSIGTIRSGWQSNMFPEIGVGVLAHELGHIVSFTAQEKNGGREQYEATRMCIAEGHTKLAGGLDVNAFKQFQEEDWADSFAVSTLNQLQKTWPYAENFACSLMDLDVKASDMPYKGLNLFDERNIDTHSSSFLRALQVQVGLGKSLPSSCVKAMSESENAVVGKVCGK